MMIEKRKDTSFKCDICHNEYKDAPINLDGKKLCYDCAIAYIEGRRFNR